MLLQMSQAEKETYWASGGGEAGFFFLTGRERERERKKKERERMRFFMTASLN